MSDTTERFAATRRRVRSLRFVAVEIVDDLSPTGKKLVLWAADEIESLIAELRDARETCAQTLAKSDELRREIEQRLAENEALKKELACWRQLDELDAEESWEDSAALAADVIAESNRRDRYLAALEACRDALERTRKRFEEQDGHNWPGWFQVRGALSEAAAASEKPATT